MNSSSYKPMPCQSVFGPTFFAPVYSFGWLCDMMKAKNCIQLMDHVGNIKSGLITGIMPESGSGKDWLVKIGNETVYVKAV